jgi:hypothetical protein
MVPILASRDEPSQPVKPSIRSVTPPSCLWHGYVTEGQIVNLSDSKLTP